MPVSPSQFPALATAALAPVMLEEYSDTPAVYPSLCTRISDDELYSPFGHKETVIPGFGEPEEREDGQEIASDDMAEGYTARMKVRLFSRSVSIPERLLEQMDDAGVQRAVLEGTRGWGRGFVARKERAVAGLFNSGRLNAGSAAVFNQSFAGEADPYPTVIYDGESFFGAAHPNRFDSSTTYDNTLDATALSATSLDTAIVRLTDTNAFNERGIRIDIPATTLLVPAALQAAAMRAIESRMLPGTAQNDVNPYFGRLQVIPWRYLTDSDGWFVGSAGAGAGSRGVIYYDNGEPDIRVHFDESTRSFVISAESRFGAAVADYRAWVGANLSAS